MQSEDAEIKLQSLKWNVSYKLVIKLLVENLKNFRSCSSENCHINKKELGHEVSAQVGAHLKNKKSFEGLLTVAGIRASLTNLSG